MRPRLSLISWNTISWSGEPNPGNIWFHELHLVYWWEINKYVNVAGVNFDHLFKIVIYHVFVKVTYSSLDLHASNGDSFDQFLSGRLKSPIIHMWLYCGMVFRMKRHKCLLCLWLKFLTILCCHNYVSVRHMISGWTWYITWWSSGILLLTDRHILRMISLSSEFNLVGLVLLALFILVKLAFGWTWCLLILTGLLWRVKNSGAFSLKEWNKI